MCFTQLAITVAQKKLFHALKKYTTYTKAKMD